MQPLAWQSETCGLESISRGPRGVPSTSLCGDTWQLSCSSCFLLLCDTMSFIIPPPPQKKKPVKFSAWGWGPAVLFPQLAWLVDGGCPSPWDDGEDSDGGSIPITKEHIGEILGNLWESLETSFPHRLQTISHRPTALVGPGRTQPKGASPRSCAPEEKQQKYAWSWQQQGNKKGVRM